MPRHLILCVEAKVVTCSGAGVCGWKAGWSLIAEGCSAAAGIDAEGKEPGIEALRSVASTATGGSAKGSTAGGAASEAGVVPEADVDGPHGAVAGGLPLAPVDRTAGGGCRSGTAQYTATMMLEQHVSFKTAQRADLH